VIGEEGGGWLGGLSGTALATGACIALGVATEGLGLFLCGFAGGLGGGILGSYFGGEAGEAVGTSVRSAGEVLNPAIERAIWGNKPIPALGYEPPPLFGQERHH
jgi:hypothetical protein